MYLMVFLLVQLPIAPTPMATYRLDSWWFALLESGSYTTARLQPRLAGAQLPVQQWQRLSLDLA